MSPAPIVYINGWPGTGKETIARLMEQQSLGRIKAVRNHLHIDLAEAVSSRGSAGYQVVRKALRNVIFSAIAQEENLTYIYVFTDFQSNNELGASVAKEYQDAAKLRGSEFLSVTLVCELEENERRILSEGRKLLVEGGSRKLLNTGMLTEMRDRGSLFRFGGCVEQMEVDVTIRQAQESAQIIAARLMLMETRQADMAREIKSDHRRIMSKLDMAVQDSPETISGTWRLAGT